MKKLIPIAAVISALTSAQAIAACTQGNLAGTWTAYSVSVNSGALAWTTCTLVINAAGGFSTNTSACLTSSGVSANAQGTLKLFKAATCAFNGSIKFPAYGTTDYIRAVTVSLDHMTASGIGGGGSYGGVFVFNMVRTK